MIVGLIHRSRGAPSDLKEPFGADARNRLFAKQHHPGVKDRMIESKRSLHITSGDVIHETAPERYNCCPSRSSQMGSALTTSRIVFEKFIYGCTKCIVTPGRGH
jgi:hypothetical protein